MSGRKGKAESRRDFLKTAGKLAVYTPPAMMLLTKASANGIASCVTKPNGGEPWTDNIPYCPVDPE